MPKRIRVRPKAGSKFVAYYRVSDVKQGESGLGLEAQRASVQRYVAGVKEGVILGEYTEVETGKKHGKRPQLAAAIKEAKRTGATLCIAKLDRLARNVHFISGLMENAADFVACDLPFANRLTIHIMAAMAEHEGEMISQRTREGLAAVQRQLAEQGFRISRRSGQRFEKLGNPNWRAALELAWTKRKKPPKADEVLRLLTDYQRQGLSLRAIAHQLNELGIRTPTGATWYASSVRRITAQANGG